MAKSKPVVVLSAVTTVCLMAIGFLVAGEWAARYRERHRDTIPGSFPSAYYRHERLTVAMVRNLDYYGWFHVNSHGFRGPEIPVEQTPGRLRFMVVGGSAAFESQVTSDSRTWPARLQYWLEELGGFGDVEVINAGTPGYSVFDNLIRLQMELFQFDPDLIVLYQGHNDVSCATVDQAGRRRGTGNRPYQVAAESPWKRWLQQHSELYNKLLARWRTIRARTAGRQVVHESKPQKTTAPTPLQCGPRQFERDVASFLAVAQTLGIEVVIVQIVHASGADATAEADSTLRSYWRNTRPYVEPDSALRTYGRYREILQQVAERHSVKFIPTGQFGIEGMRYYGTRDPMHFNDEGADRMGRKVAEALLDLNVFDTLRLRGQSAQILSSRNAP